MHHSTRVVRTLAVWALVGCAAHPGLATLALAHPSGSHADVGAGISTLSQDSLYVRSQDGVQLYNSPAGTTQAALVPLSSWLRDTTLVPITNTTALRPARSPIDLRLAPATSASVTAVDTSGAGTSPAPAPATVGGLAAITSEDQVPVGLSVSTLAGQAPLAATGQASGDTLTYPSVAPATDLALRSTAEGLDARVILHSRTQAGSLAFTLNVPPNFHLVQEANGSISVNETITAYSDQGKPALTEESSEYHIELPVVRDASADGSAATSYGTAAMALGPRAGDTQQVSVTIDPIWLQDTRRTFPVQLDLPVVTGPAAGETGLFGTLSSCQPDLPAPAARMVVGAQGGCSYHGLAYFDLGPIGIRRHVQTVQSAILSLYTPNQVGPTGVQVYPNTPPTRLPRYAPLSWQQPSWNTAPAVTSGTTGIAQSSSDGHWQHWDITSLVQQWQDDPHSNGGITLVGTGAPVAFASAAGAGDDTPANAPYLDLTFAPAPVSAAGVSPNFNLGDPVSSVYGVSQGLVPNGTCNGAPQCSFGLEVQTLRNNWGASYYRIPTPLACTTGDPGVGWWVGTYNMLKSAYSLGSNLIPIVSFNYPDGSCQTSQFNWADQLRHFAEEMKLPGSPLASVPQPWTNTYFEIENEPNSTNPPRPDWYGCYLGTCGQGRGYMNTFATAAPALNSALNNAGLPNGRILTGGLVAPDSGLCGNNNAGIMQVAINGAESNGVPQGRLGVAVHPYGYTTTDAGFWRNYKGQLGFTTTTCTSLGSMLGNWTSDFPNMPVIFTETDFATDPGVVNRYSYNNTGEGQNGEVAYVADLATYLDDTGYGSPSTSPVRVLWYTGVEHSDFLGIYTSSAGEKYPGQTGSTYRCGGTVSSPIYCTTPGLAQGVICPYLGAGGGNLNGQLNNLSYTYATTIQRGQCY